MVLGQVIQEGFPEEVIFEERLKVVREEVQADGPGRIPGRGNCQYKDPEVGADLMRSRNSREASVAGTVIGYE